MEEAIGLVKKALTGWKDFSGRSRRKEYWFFFLAVIVGQMAFGIIDGIIGTDGVLIGLFSLAVIVPTVAVGIRRLHDQGKSGWYLLLGLVPFVGGFVIIYFMVQDSQPGTNQYGPNPKGM